MKFNIDCKAFHGNEDCFETIAKILSLEANEEILFDFTGLKETNPFNMLLISNAIKNLSERRPLCKISVIPKDSDDYLEHVGFYDSCGNIDYGKKMGQAFANCNYVPITLLDFSSFNGSFYEQIENKSEQLASVLKFDKNLSSFMKYIFIETIRNVYEHAQINQVKICAQKWTSFSLVEIAIADQGCGVANAMKKRHPFNTDKELLEKSCMPGVSANSNHAFLSPDDVWRNSGFGLYALKALAIAYGGSFIICSGNHAFYESAQGKIEYSTQYDGTALCLRFSTNTNLDFQKVRAQIISGGEKLAKVDKSAHKSASKSSGGSYNG